MMRTLLVSLQTLLAAHYRFSGRAKIIGAKYWTEMFDGLRLPQWFRVVTGALQLLGVAGLIAGYWDSRWLVWTAVWLLAPMIVAFLLHIRVTDPPAKPIPLSCLRRCSSLCWL